MLTTLVNVNVNLAVLSVMFPFDTNFLGSYQSAAVIVADRLLFPPEAEVSSCSCHVATFLQAQFEAEARLLQLMSHGPRVLVVRTHETSPPSRS